MRIVRSWIGLALVASMVAACSDDSRVPDLIKFRSTGQPDEFSVTVYRPLEVPELGAEPPVPGQTGEDRAEFDPVEDVRELLGGRPTAGRDGRTPGSDSTLMTYASRMGSSDHIREIVAAEDVEYRRQNDGRLLERLFMANLYFRAYEPMTLDSTVERERLINLGYQMPPLPE